MASDELSQMTKARQFFSKYLPSFDAATLPSPSADETGVPIIEDTANSFSQQSNKFCEGIVNKCPLKTCADKIVTGKRM